MPKVAYAWHRRARAPVGAMMGEGTAQRCNIQQRGRLPGSSQRSNTEAVGPAQLWERSNLMVYMLLLRKQTDVRLCFGLSCCCIRDV